MRSKPCAYERFEMPRVEPLTVKEMRRHPERHHSARPRDAQDLGSRLKRG